MSPTTLLLRTLTSIITPTTPPSLSPRELPPTTTPTSTANSNPSFSTYGIAAFAIIIGLFFIGLTLCCCLTIHDEENQTTTTTPNQNPSTSPNRSPTQYQSGNPYQSQYQSRNQRPGQGFYPFRGGSEPIGKPRPTQSSTFGTGFTRHQYGGISSGVIGRDATNGNGNGNGTDNSVEGERIRLENMRQKVKALEQKLDVADPPPVYQAR